MSSQYVSALLMAAPLFPADAEGLARMARHAETLPYDLGGYVLRSLVPGRTNWFVRCAPTCSAGLPATEPPTGLPGTEDRLLRLRATVVPDAYESDGGQPVCVPGMELSVEMQRAFAEAGAGATLAWRCSLSAEFGKWVPLAGGRS